LSLLKNMKVLKIVTTWVEISLNKKRTGRKITHG
jgi:hypothetical protein